MTNLGADLTRCRNDQVPKSLEFVNSVVNKINCYCVPGLQLDGVKQYVNSERFEKLCKHHRVIVFLSEGVKDIPENIDDRTERELTKDI